MGREMEGRNPRGARASELGTFPFLGVRGDFLDDSRPPMALCSRAIIWFLLIGHGGGRHHGCGGFS